MEAFRRYIPKSALEALQAEASTFSAEYVRAWKRPGI